MKFFKIGFMALALLLLTKLALACHFERQIDEITKNPENAPQCIGISTRKFRGGETISKEYFFYICRLNPDIKSFAYYYDRDNKKILSKIVFPFDFESLQIASPLICFKRMEDNILEQSCGVYISSSLSGMKGKDFIFRSPWIEVEHSETTKETVD